MRRPSLMLTLSAALALSGCGGDNGPLPVETSESLYQDGQRLQKQGRMQEALSDYLKLISRRGDQAPESHLEAGVIELQEIKDPIAAIFHFRRYLELEPNSRLRDHVMDLIQAARRDFAATLPASGWQPAPGGDVSDEAARLRLENAQLRAKLDTLEAKALTPTFHPVPTDEPPPAAAPASFNTVLVPRAPSASPAPAEPVAAAGSKAPRTHVVVAGDTLYKLSNQYYGSGSHWREIRDANRDKLAGDSPKLNPGMELKIP